VWLKEVYIITFIDMQVNFISNEFRGDMHYNMYPCMFIVMIISQKVNTYLINGSYTHTLRKAHNLKV